jgi:hypothetical protein
LGFRSAGSKQGFSEVPLCLLSPKYSLSYFRYSDFFGQAIRLLFGSAQIELESFDSYYCLF